MPGFAGARGSGSSRTDERRRVLTTPLRHDGSMAAAGDAGRPGGFPLGARRFRPRVPGGGDRPAYIPLIALAGWLLGLGNACAVALAAAFLNIFPRHADEVGRVVLRLGTYAFVVATVSSLRRVHDRRARSWTGPRCSIPDRRPAASRRARRRILISSTARTDDFHGHTPMRPRGSIVIYALLTAIFAFLQQNQFSFISTKSQY